MTSLFVRNVTFFTLVAGSGFEPMTSGLWARRATRLLYPAMLKGPYSRAHLVNKLIYDFYDERFRF